MPRKLKSPHELLEISEPCSAEWDSMSGNERVRFCAHCRLHVQNLSEVTPRQAMELVLRSGGRLCLRIERNTAGTPRTRSLAEPLHQIKRRASRLAAGAFGAALTLCSSAAAQAQTVGPEPARQAAPARADAAPTGFAGASLVGTVTDPAGAVIPSTPVALTNQETGEQLRLTTGEDGAYRFDGLAAGTYTLKVERQGFEPSETRDLKVQPGPEQRVDVSLQLPDGQVVTVGTLAIVEPSDALVKAAMDDDLEAVRRLLLFEGADANVVDKRLGITPLAQAYANGNREVIRELLWRGARVNERFSYRQTALMHIGEKTTADVVRDLLDAGAKVNLRDEDGNTVLMGAAGYGRQELVELLLRAGAKINARDKQGRTALMYAAIAGATETLRALVLAGADISARDEDGHTALWHARDNDHDDTASLLLAYGAYKDPADADPEAQPERP